VSYLFTLKLPPNPQELTSALPHSNFFTYSGSNAALSGFLNAITLVVEEGYLLALIIGIPLNLVIPYGPDDLATTGSAEEQESHGLPTVTTSAEQSARSDDVKVV